MPNPLYCIAHRGGPGPDNSLEAIQRSLALGVDAIEIDIWQLHGELFVTHDRRLGRQIRGDAALQSLTREQLEALRLENGEPIPTLHQVLELLDGRTLLNVEIKGPDCASLLAKTLIAHTQDKDLSLEQYLVSSFDHQQLFQMLKILPEVRRGALVAGVPLDYAGCCDALQAYSFHTSLDFLDAGLTTDAHARGLQHWVYTANYPDEWRALSDHGVDAVFTDRPAELLAFNAGQNTAPHRS